MLRGTSGDVAVIGLAVGVGEFGGFDDRVDEVGAGWVHGADVEALEEGELLEEDGALAPGAAFEDGVAVVVVGDGVFDGGVPLGEILGGEEAAVAAAGGVEHGLGGEEFADGFGDEALIPGAVGGFDAGFAGGADGFAAEAFVGVGDGRVPEEFGGRGRAAVGEEDGGAGGPFGFEEGGGRIRWWQGCGGRGGRRCGHSRWRRRERRRVPKCPSRGGGGTRRRRLRGRRPAGSRCRG